MHDLRYAFRQLVKSPGFTMVAILTLALGIGANTAIFSLVQSVLLNPLPYPNPDRLIILWEDAPNFAEASISWPDLQDWQRDNTTLTALGGYRRDDFSLTGLGEPEMLHGAKVNASFFTAMGLPPTVGRLFNVEEDKPGAPALIVLSHRLWQRRFSGDTAVIGRTINLNGESSTVVGVLPAEFTTPNRVDFYTIIKSDDRYFLPLEAVDDEALRRAGLRFASGDNQEHLASRPYVPDLRKAS